ncbi:hypothetical protein F4801DRAFT_532524 [Xylaria longipes]|nr:hypothetical protein F4801DRAFT_532524 [Xylaria longipes]
MHYLARAMCPGLAEGRQKNTRSQLNGFSVSPHMSANIIPCCLSTSARWVSPTKELSGKIAENSSSSLKDRSDRNAAFYDEIWATSIFRGCPTIPLYLKKINYVCINSSLHLINFVSVLTIALTCIASSWIDRGLGLHDSRLYFRKSVIVAVVVQTVVELPCNMAKLLG